MSPRVTNFLLASLRYFLVLVLGVAILCVFVPLDPVMPAPGLDTSWMFAMNQGVARGLVFGRDIVFTFGPYASIYTKVYDPATDRLMLFGSIFLGLNYAFLLLLLGLGESIYGPLVYCVFLVCLADSRDAILFSYPLMLALVMYRMTLPADHGLRLRLSRRDSYGLAIFFAPLGLLPLIKGSLLPLCGFMAVLCFAILWIHARKDLALLAAGISAISCVMFWIISGQLVLSLPGFFWNMRLIISGYTDAMSFPGNQAECILYVLAAVVLLVVVARSARGPRSSTCFLCIAYAFFLFIAFKSGFVRHDPWHNVIAGTSLLASAMLLIFVLGHRASVLPVATALLVWAFIGHGTVPTTTEAISANLRTTFERSFVGMQTRWAAKDSLQKRYDASLASMRDSFPIPRMDGATDIYSYNQSWLLASGNTWDPRPVTQSYSAYTPELAEMNARHLQSASAPDNIVFRIEPIDGRLPSLEDGRSWPALINRYSLRKLDRGTAYLRKRPDENQDAPREEEVLHATTHQFGENVSLPDSNDPIFATMEIQPTLLGKVRAALYKLPELHITLNLRDGTKITYRGISNMMKSEFLLTPLVKNTDDFALLAAGGAKYLTGNEVSSLVISSDDRRGLFWSTHYSLSLHKPNLLKNDDTENSLLFDNMDEPPPGSLSPALTTVCEGMIESVNGNPPRAGIPPVGNALSVKGWMAISGKDGIVPDVVFVTITNEKGKTIYVKARSMRRDDVRLHFQQPRMPDPGYETMIDVSSLNGRYKLGLARTFKGTLGICQQFKLPFVIAR